MGGRSARRDGGIAPPVPISHGEEPGATIGPAGETTTARKTRKTHDPVSSQPQAADHAEVQAAHQAGIQGREHPKTDAERVAAEQQFRRRIEHELTVELRSVLHLTLAGTAARFDWHGRSFTLTFGGLVERTRTTPSGGLSAYTLRAWCLAPADTQQGVHNFAEGELQASLLEYFGIGGSR
jgi:hypothetical protein